MRSVLKAIVMALAIICATATTTPAQQTPPSPAVLAKIRELENNRFEAQRRKDNTALDAMLDNALVWVGPDGVQKTKADYLEDLHSAGTSVLDLSPVSMTIDVHGNTAVVVGIYREKGVKDGRAYQLRARFIDTWMLKNGKWLCIASTSTSVIS